MPESNRCLVSSDKSKINKDAAEMVQIEYELLPVVTDAISALKPGAPLIWEDCAGNVPLDAELGDEFAVAKAFEKASHIIERRFFNNRVITIDLFFHSVLISN